MQRQTNRQTDKQTNRHTDKQLSNINQITFYREEERLRHNNFEEMKERKYIETETETERERERHQDRQTDKQTILNQLFPGMKNVLDTTILRR
jgi:hypothetical protein